MMNNQFEELAENFTKRAEKVGLYARDCVIIGQNMTEEDRDKINSPEIKQMLQDGEAKLVLMVTFTVGDLAFSDRIQNPGKYDTDRQFAEMMPTESEMKIDHVRESLSSINEFSSKEDILAALNDLVALNDIVEEEEE